MTISLHTKVCPMCHNPGVVEVLESELNAYRNGQHVEVAFKSLDAAQREMIITGIHGPCWEQIFGEDDE